MEWYRVLESEVWVLSKLMPIFNLSEPYLKIEKYYRASQDEG
jgi:hypothetical protein